MSLVKYINALVIVVCWSVSSHAQVTLSASDDSGSGYMTTTASGFEIENPDCKHTDFGPHITQEYDSLLQKNVFRYHSHIDDDNDRCINEDRVRMEIKGGPNSSTELQHAQNTFSYYRWKFMLPADFVGSSNFCHIFQNKIFGGNDSSFPVITVTPRASVVQIIHNGGDTGADLGNVAQADIDLFRGRWIEGYIEQYHAEQGSINMFFRDLSNGDTILSYQNNSIDLWRDGAEYDRPKWGMYRKKADGLKDEYILLADFCVSETSAELCPAEPNLIEDLVAPSTPLNLIASNSTISSIDLAWDEASDNVAVDAYNVFQDGVSVWEGAGTSTTISNLQGSTVYQFYVVAIDGAGNSSIPSNEISASTADTTLVPDPAFDPNPGNGDFDVSLGTALSWTPADNTDSVRIYFGTTNPPALLATTTSTSYSVDLEPTTTYFWQIESINANGDTLSPIWSFTTAAANVDFPWLVYRANERPEIETPFFELNTEPDNPLVDDQVTDPNGSGNSFYRYHYDGEENFRWRYRFDEVDTSITIVARFKAIEPDVNGVIYYEIRGFGWREKIRINQSTIKLEKSSPVIEVDLPNDLNKHMHVIRIVMKGNETTVYWDENSEPIAFGISSDDDTNEFFEWGKSGSQEYGAQIDWISIVLNQAWAPGEGDELPEDLFFSSDANLSTLALDGMPIEGFDPCVYEYEVDWTSTTVPDVTYELSSDYSEAVLTLPTSVPDTEVKINVDAEDGFTSQEYTVVLKDMTSTTDSEINHGIKLYPNPADSYIVVKQERGHWKELNIRDVLGNTVLRVDSETEVILNIEQLSAGFYVLEVVQDNGVSSSHPFIREKK